MFDGSAPRANLLLPADKAATENLRSRLTVLRIWSSRARPVDEVAAFAAAVLHRHHPHHRAALLTSEASWDSAAKIPPW